MIKKGNIFVLAALLAAATCQEQQTFLRCCQVFDETNTRCLACPHGAIPFGNDCVLYLDRCEKYEGCYSCSQCFGDYELVDTEFNGRPTKKCEPSMKPRSSVSVTITLQKLEQTEAKTEKDTVKEKVQKQVLETKQQNKGESSNSNETKQEKVQDKEQEISSLPTVQSEQQNIRKQSENNVSGEAGKKKEKGNDAGSQQQIKIVEQPKQEINLKAEKDTNDIVKDNVKL